MKMMKRADKLMVKYGDDKVEILVPGQDENSKGNLKETTIIQNVWNDQWYGGIDFELIIGTINKDEELKIG